LEIINKILNKIDQHFYKILDGSIKIWLVFFCTLKKIKMGKNNLFFGHIKFYRSPQSIINIGSNCRFRSRSTSNLIGINHRCIISTQDKNAILTIGNNCGFSGTSIGCFSSITIKDNVKCGANTLITDGDWHMNDTRVGPAKPILIEENVWLGYGSIVLKGVTIGKNSIIGAGSIVTTNIPANCIAAGNPCKVIKLQHE
jgi:acetyltransferase-like isoleucine patch superfamily enzyme